MSHYVNDDCPGGHRDEACRECGGQTNTFSTSRVDRETWVADVRVCRRCNGTGIEPKEEPR